MKMFWNMLKASFVVVLGFFIMALPMIIYTEVDARNIWQWLLLVSIPFGSAIIGMLVMYPEKFFGGMEDM